MNTQQAAEVLDNAIFGSHIFNMRYDEDEVLITFEGENFVVAELATGELHHFRCAIEPHEWDSAQALRDQEFEPY